MRTLFKISSKVNHLTNLVSSNTPSCHHHVMTYLIIWRPNSAFEDISILMLSCINWGGYWRPLPSSWDVSGGQTSPICIFHTPFTFFPQAYQFHTSLLKHRSIRFGNNSLGQLVCSGKICHWGKYLSFCHHIARFPLLYQFIVKKLPPYPGVRVAHGPQGLF